MTKQNGVDVWPNAAIWMRDELRSVISDLQTSSWRCSLLIDTFAFRSMFAGVGVSRV